LKARAALRGSCSSAAQGHIGPVTPPPSIQPDLFGAAPAQPGSPDEGWPAGLAFHPDVLAADEEASLLARLALLPVEPFRFQQWTGKRRVASFGWRYDFTDASFAAAQPVPDWLVPVQERVAASAGLTAADLAQVMVTRYDPGAGIGWHRDRPVFDEVHGLSLGTPAVLRLRRRTDAGFERFALPLPPGSLYSLRGTAREAWEHSIAPIGELRWSITFRTLRGALRRA